MTIPVSVVLDRTPYGTGPLDLTPMVAEDSLEWSTVVPGGFGSCTFTLDGDFRQLTRLIPYLSILRVLGDSGRVLFEGQIEDKAPSLSEDGVSMNVGAFGLQNELDETYVRRIFTKRDLTWDDTILVPGNTLTSLVIDPGFAAAIGQYDPTNLATSGVQLTPNPGISALNGHGYAVVYQLPINLSGLTSWLGSRNSAGTDSGSTKWSWLEFQYIVGTGWSFYGSGTAAGVTTFNHPLDPAASQLAVAVWNESGGTVAFASNDTMAFYDMRVIGVVSGEDVTDGIYGDTLLEAIVNLSSTLGIGIVESGSDFAIDQLDASDAARSLRDLVTEVASYYSREWAIWEDALFHWRTPQLSQPQWVIPLAQLTALDLDAAVTNSKQQVVLNYVDAASGLGNRTVASSTDRRNPYVLLGRSKMTNVTAEFPMTSNTAGQLAALLLQDLGFGPVPASGTISVNGDTIIQHAQGNALKAWEIRAGDNITIPELPLADVFTQDGRGECLFHVISAEASTQNGQMTFTLDSYGSKRSDVLMARLAAVTQALTG